MHVLHIPNMCIFMYVCIHVYMCKYVYVCGYMFLCMCMHVLCVYTCLYMCACLHTCMGDTSLLALREPADHLCLAATLLFNMGTFDINGRVLNSMIL